MKDSFIFYKSFVEAINTLNDEDRLKAYDAIANYAIYGEEPQVKGVANVVFIMAKPQIDANYDKSQNGKKGGRPKKEEVEKPVDIEKKTTGLENEKPLVTESENHRLDNSKPNVNVNDNANVNELKESTKEKPNVAKAPTRFVKPSIAQLKDYAEQKGYTWDVDAFRDYYEANGWRVGKNPMKDWKSAMANWERRRRDFSAPKLQTQSKTMPDYFLNKEPTDKELPTSEDLARLDALIAKMEGA